MSKFVGIPQDLTPFKERRLMRLVPIIPNTRFNQQRHINLATILHNVDDFLLRSL